MVRYAWQQQQQQQQQQQWPPYLSILVGSLVSIVTIIEPSSFEREAGSAHAIVRSGLPRATCLGIPAVKIQFHGLNLLLNVAESGLRLHTIQYDAKTTCQTLLQAA